MAWLVRNSDSGGGYPPAASWLMPSATIGATVGDYIEIKSAALSGNPGGNYRLLGQQVGFINLVELSSSNLLIRFNSGVNRTFSTGYVQPPIGAIFTLRVTRSAAGQWQASLNGTSIGTVSDSGNLVLDSISAFASSTSEAYRGDIYYIAISTNGGASATRYYDPSASGGTGTVLTDIVSSQNATQNAYWPSDNSEWVFYSSGATYQLTAQGGTFTYSGQTAALNRGFKLAAQGGSYSYTGASANLSYTTATVYRLDALGASYSYAGASASLLRGFVLDAQGGAYSYAGASADLSVLGPMVYRLTALGVTYVYSGADATLTATGVIPAANPAAFVNRAYVGGRLTNNAKIGGSLTNNATVAI